MAVDWIWKKHEIIHLPLRYRKSFGLCFILMISHRKREAEEK